MSDKFYLTTTLPYVNADPHIGFALEMVQADIICRYQRLLGKDIIFNTGTDEHGLKIYRKAHEQGKDPQSYVDEYAAKFDQLKQALNLSYNRFIRTTDAHHKQAAQEFWRRCLANGDIYKKNYQVKYCVGCELEKTESELANGHCLIHPNLELEIIDEENYFFRWSNYQQLLLDYYKAHADFVVPEFRFREIIAFVEQGLQDFSISRIKEKMPWGVPVPDDDTQVMYVWFDALINYISTLGWPEDEQQFRDFWGSAEQPNAVQIAGKDNLRQQSAMWQAMLLSAGLPPSKQIIIHGFITSEGQKMSKSVGNVVNPYEALQHIQEFGLTPQQATDALRYYLAREISTFEDGDFSWGRFKESYNGSLANGIGNLTSRILKMAQSVDVKLESVNHQLKFWTDEDPDLAAIDSFSDYTADFAQYNIKKAADKVWAHIAVVDGQIQRDEPFKVIKTDLEKGQQMIHYLLRDLNEVALMLQPFLPHTSDQIFAALENPQAEIPRLFPRIQ